MPPSASPGMDFETAVRERIPILSVLSNNFSMAIELKIMPTSTRRYRSTDISGNYAEFARALGGYGERDDRGRGDRARRSERGIEQTEAGVPALLEFITSKEEAFSHVLNGSAGRGRSAISRGRSSRARAAFIDSEAPATIVTPQSSRNRRRCLFVEPRIVPGAQEVQPGGVAGALHSSRGPPRAPADRADRARPR